MYLFTVFFILFMCRLANVLFSCVFVCVCDNAHPALKRKIVSVSVSLVYDIFFQCDMAFKGKKT